VTRLKQDTAVGAPPPSPHWNRTSTNVGDVSELYELDNLANSVRNKLLGELHAAESRSPGDSRSD
jgi:hypothetical protein